MSFLVHVNNEYHYVKNLSENAKQLISEINKNEYEQITISDWNGNNEFYTQLNYPDTDKIYVFISREVSSHNMTGETTIMHFADRELAIETLCDFYFDDVEHCDDEFREMFYENKQKLIEDGDKNGYCFNIFDNSFEMFSLQLEDNIEIE